MWFETCLGLTIKLEKSELILVGKVPNLVELTKFIRCKVGSRLATYLGLPLATSCKSNRIWKIRSKKDLLCRRGKINFDKEYSFHFENMWLKVEGFKNLIED